MGCHSRQRHRVGKCIGVDVELLVFRQRAGASVLSRFSALLKFIKSPE